MKETMAKQDTLPTPAEQKRFSALGLELDEMGRPLHPWRSRYPDLQPGKGRYWEWGPNYTVDPIILNAGHILLVQRADNHLWALPGGFIDRGESPDQAGRREASEETGINDLPETSVEVYRGPVSDERSSLNAWADTTALLWRPETRQQPTASEESDDTAWLRLDTVAQLHLHGSHHDLISRAIAEFGTLEERILFLVIQVR